MNPPTKKQIIPLHTHTSYSVLDGASDIDAYISWCLSNGSPALGVTDHGWVIGALELISKCKKAGLTSLPGCEFYVAPNPGHVFAKKEFHYYHVTVFATSEIGYRNLIKLASLSFSGPDINGKKRVLKFYGSPKPRITFAELFEHNEGLTVGSGCLIGAATKCLLQGEKSQAEHNLIMLNDVFKGRFYAELMPHKCFESSTMVDMADGTRREISLIKSGDMVLSYDFSKQRVVSSKVVNVFESPASENEFCGSTFYGRGDHHAKTPIFSTKDHPFFNGSEWVKAIDATVGCVKSKYLSETSKDALIGTMLGDSSVVISDCFQYSQAEKRAGMVNAIAAMLGTYVSISPPRQTKKQNTHRTSSSHPYFVGFREKWYPSGKKIVPRDLRLTPVMLAWWFMDDGSGCFRSFQRSSGEFKNYYSTRLCTQGFTKDDNEFLQRELHAVFGLKSSLVKSTDKVCIAFDSENSIILNKIIAEHVLPCAEYKLLPEFRGQYQPHIIEDRLDIFPSVSRIRVALVAGRDFTKKFNLEVEGDHNYFVHGILVHNCDYDYSRQTKQFVHNECSPFAPDGDLQKACNLQMAEWSKKLGIPPLLTIDAHFVSEEQHKIQTLLLQNGDPSGWHFKTSYHQKTTEEAWVNWQVHFGSDINSQKLFTDSIENQYQIADSARYLKITDKLHQPVPEIPIDIRTAVSDPSKQRKLLLMRLIEKHGRMKWDSKAYQDRLAKEIDAICDNGALDFSDYFIFLEKWCSWAMERGILTGIGRGSACGSLLSYLLKITHLDSVALDLPFERFLSTARIKRGKFPDIDLDFSSREIMMAAFKTTYGDKYAQISTHGTIKIKTAIKDVARILLGKNSGDVEINALTKSIPNAPMGVTDKNFLLGYVDTDGNFHKGHLEQNPTLEAFFDKYPDLFKMVMSILGIPRSVGRHASATVVSDEPISNSVPTCIISDEPCTQYVASGANYVEKAGLVKFDILGLNSLKDIGGAIRLIQKTMGYNVWEETLTLGEESFKITLGELTIEQIPLAKKGEPGLILNIYDLPEVSTVFADISKGKTSSCFQISTDGITGFCERVRPTKCSELSDIIALYRPGPLDGEIEPGLTFADAYILRKSGVLPVTYPHPDLEPILKDTFGVFVFQEQIQKAFGLAGYDEVEADLWREVLAKKKKEEVEKFIPELRTRLLERGWTAEQAQVFVSACIASSSYSFNKSHSYAYGNTAYITAFLKHFFSVQWWTSVLQNSKIDDIKEKNYDFAVKDILISPHINGPMDTFELRDGKIHAPMYLIDGVGDKACGAIKQAVVEGLPYDSFQEFFERVDKRLVNSKVFERMIVCGGFDQLRHDADLGPKPTRQQLLEQYYYLSRVSGLVAGRGKIGLQLEIAAKAYQAANPEEAKAKQPLLSLSDTQLELKKVEWLPIYRPDVHVAFRALLEKWFLYEGDKVFYENQADDTKLQVLTKASQFGPHHADIKTRKQSVFWCGLLREGKAFDYISKKTGEKQFAYKMFISNGAETIECVMWPRVFEQYGPPAADGILMVVGNIEKGRESGVYQLFVNSLQVLK
jgi:DNA-directed DNA polymerase III PolC